MNGIGAHEVLVETPDHASTLATLPQKSVEEVLWAYRDRVLDLKNDRRFRYILLFKNHGEAAGATVEHAAHSATASLFRYRSSSSSRGSRSQRSGITMKKNGAFFCRHDPPGKPIIGDRVIHENEHFIAIAPYAPRFPFESWILPKQHSSAFENMPSALFTESLSSLLRDFLSTAGCGS